MLRPEGARLESSTTKSAESIVTKASRDVRQRAPGLGGVAGVERENTLVPHREKRGKLSENITHTGRPTSTSNFRRPADNDHTTRTDCEGRRPDRSVMLISTQLASRIALPANERIQA